MRNVRLNLTNEDMIQIAVSIDSWEKLWMAIGYLSTWNMSYPTVHVFRGTDDDLTAVYLDETGNTKYVIGAVWHGDHYGFHS